jgi:hypothetical protein
MMVKYLEKNVVKRVHWSTQWVQGHVL